MESIIKDLPIPKEAQKMIQDVPELAPFIEPEPQGIGVGGCVGIAALVLVGAAVLARLYKCTSKKGDGTMKMQNNGNGNGGGNGGGGGISKKDLELLIEKASQTGPTQTIRIEQAPIKISTDEKPYTL